MNDSVDRDGPARSAPAPSARLANPASPAARLAAVLWDVDGTLAETEREGHLIAFNGAFAAEGIPWRWDDARYGKLLEVAGGRERLLHDMSEQPAAPASMAEREQLASHLHRLKNRLYVERVALGGIVLRPGVRELIDECRDRGIALAVTTTTPRASVAALLESQLGADWQSRFSTLVCSEDVQRKKPDPEVFQIALQRLHLEPGQVVAIEDSPNGVIAARAAGCPVVVTRSLYFADAVIEGALAVGPGLDTRDGWQPPVPAAGDGRATIGIDDILYWLQHSAGRG